MSLLVQVLFWCAIQVTLFAAGILVVNSLVGRRRPAAGAFMAVCALVAISGLTAAAFSSQPRWPLSSDANAGREVGELHAAIVDQSIDEATLGQEFSSLKENQARQPNRETSETRPTSKEKMLTAQAGALLGTIWEHFRRAQLPAESVSRWAVAALIVYFLGVAAMAVRLALGVASVRRYAHRSRPIDDPALRRLADELCANLGCQRRVELREIASLATPATIGWLRPVVLFPTDWRNWTPPERRAVLAHELAHVRRSDFAAWLAAQVGVALHFYHPLVHRLAARLRLQQELAADAAAARTVGGQRDYVTILAAMTLRQSDAAAAWPARAFLPTSTTFLRRIEMLRRAHTLRSDISRPLRYLSVAAVLAATVGVAGFRASTAVGENPPTLSVANAPQHGVEMLLAQAPEQQQGNPLQRSPFLTRGSLNKLKQLALAMHNYYDRNKHFPSAVVMGPDGKTPHSWRVELLPFLDELELYKQYRMDEPWDSANNKQILEKMPAVFRSPFDDKNTTNSSYYVLVGKGTIFEGPAGTKFQDITDGTSNTLLVVESKRSIPWTKPEDIPFDEQKPVPELGGFLEGKFAAAVADGSAHVLNLAQVKDELKWFIMRNDGHPITWPAPVTQTAEVPRPNASRPVLGDKRRRDLNNLKQMALAMHNYHDVHRHFPAASLLGPDGKTPHSWRIELLPLLDQKALYEQYRMNEPWDSANNKQVLEKMPDVFRSPYDDPKSTSSGYYVLVGPGTVFEGPDGVKISEVSDGTSNTLLVVESKRNIPWTKPDDIPFEEKKPVPELGGFIEGKFAACIADGSAHLFDLGQVKDQLKWLIIRNDGHPISWQAPVTRVAEEPQPNVSRPALIAKGRRDLNHLKQLALAMHNYHDVHAHFPADAVLGPDGKTVHSWRVALLPFLDQSALYNQYHQDEPWDSANNKKVLEQMPDVLRSPYDDPKTTNSGYYVIVGPGTAFEGKDGVRIRDISDGTSNTLLVVTAKRNIPWTKPEDIAFDPDKSLPELGGFVEGHFSAAMADGAARPFDTNKVKNQLKWLIMRNDAHPIQWP